MRLIDADNYKGKVIASNCYSGVNKIINIDDVPTAFDTDKVVQDLEETKSKYAELSLGYNNAEETKRYVSMEQTMALAIEIVKRGGLNE